MKSIYKFLSLALVFSLALNLNAQTDLKPSDKIPLKKDAIYGKLDNGLTYYIAENNTPENRAEFFLVNNVGAMQENPSQNGLAHFTEHMCFNGTKNFKEKAIINYLESIGMKFGPEINAYTVFDQTVYTLNKVPLEEKANIDTSLMILYEWSTNVVMTDEEIDLERGVIMEEWRTRRNAQFRMRGAMFESLFKNSKYAEHDIIGKTDVIQNAPYDTLRAFYNDWYRPDLQSIIAVGDFDAKEIESKIKKIFSKNSKRENPRERKYYQVPDHKETYVNVITDKEARINNVQVFYKHDPVKDKNNAKYYRKGYANQIYSIMINERLREKTQEADPPFVQAYSVYAPIIRTKSAYIAGAIAGNDKVETALRTVLEENKRVLQHGFTKGELERAKKTYMKQLEKVYNERNKQESSKIAGQFQQHFLTGEPYPGIEWEYEFGKDVLNKMTLEEVNALAKNYITKDNRVIIINAPENQKDNLPSKEKILGIVDEVDNMQTKAYVDKFSNRPLISEIPEAGKIIEESKEDDIVTWKFENGVEVSIKKNDYKDEEILMRAYSPGGTSLYSGKLLTSAQIAADVVDNSGIADFDNIELSKKLSDKNIRINPYISTYTEGFRGSTTPEDMETLLQLTHLYFTNPRVDEDAFKSFIKKRKDLLANKDLDPNSVFSDSLSIILGNYHERAYPMTAEKLDEAQLSKIKYVFNDRFSDPSGFKFYFVGNIDIETAKPLIEKYIGGLPKVSREESYKDVDMRFPKESIVTSWEREMETEKSTVFIAVTGEYKDKAENRLLIEAVEEYLNKRMLETLREEIGGTYGASVFSSARQMPTNEYFIGIYWDCDPEKRDTMIQVVYNEFQKLIDEGPDAEDIKNIIENKVKEHNEKQKKNSYWLSLMYTDDLYDNDYKNFDYNAWWEDLSTKDVKKAAKKYLNLDSKIQIYQTAK